MFLGLTLHPEEEVLGADVVVAHGSANRRRDSSRHFLASGLNGTRSALPAVGLISQRARPPSASEPHTVDAGVGHGTGSRADPPLREPDQEVVRLDVGMAHAAAAAS